MFICYLYSSLYMLTQTSNLAPSLPLPTLSPLWLLFGNHKFVFYIWVYYYFANRFICILLDFTYKRYHMISIFLWLTLLNMIVSGPIHVAASFHSFLWLSYNTRSSIHLSMDIYTAFIFWLLHVVLLWTPGYMYPFEFCFP